MYVWWSDTVKENQIIMSSLSKRFLNPDKDGETISLSLSEMIQKQQELRQDHPFNNEVVKQKESPNSRDAFNAWNMKGIVEISKEYHELSKQSDLSLLDKVEHSDNIDSTDAPNFNEGGVSPDVAQGTGDNEDDLENLLEQQPTPEEIAEQEKQALIEQLNAEAEQKAQARYEEGIADGIIKGAEQTKQELSAQFDTIANLMNSLQAVDATEMGQFRASLEKSVKDIIFDLIAVKIDHFPEVIANRITNALNQFTENINGIHLTLNPQDWDLLQNDSDFMAKIDGLSVRTNEHLRRGGCLLKSDNMEINATLEHQLNLGDDFGKAPSNQKVAEAHQMVADMLEPSDTVTDGETPVAETSGTDASALNPHENGEPSPLPNSDATSDATHGDSQYNETAPDNTRPDDAPYETPAPSNDGETPEDPNHDQNMTTPDWDSDDVHTGNSNHIGVDDDAETHSFAMNDMGDEMGGSETGGHDGTTGETLTALNPITGKMETYDSEDTLDLSQGFPQPNQNTDDDLDGFDPYAEPEDPFAIDEGGATPNDDTPPEEG